MDSLVPKIPFISLEHYGRNYCLHGATVPLHVRGASLLRFTISLASSVGLGVQGQAEQACFLHLSKSSHILACKLYLMGLFHMFILEQMLLRCSGLGHGDIVVRYLSMF